MAHHHIDREKSHSAPPKVANLLVACSLLLPPLSFCPCTYYTPQMRDITHPNVVVGMAVFCGGLAQLLAGMWEYPRNNAFGASVFTSYGAFWMSYATILLPGSGILAAFTYIAELTSVLGIYLIAWFIVTFLFLIVLLRKNIGLVVLFAFLTTTFLPLAIGQFTGSLSVAKSGAALDVITPIITYYVGLADLLAADNVHLPPWKIVQHPNTQICCAFLPS